MYNYTLKLIQILRKYYSLLENKKQLFFRWLKLSPIMVNMDVEFSTFINHLILIFFQLKW